MVRGFLRIFACMIRMIRVVHILIASLLSTVCLLVASCGDGSRQRLQLEELEHRNRADSLMTNDSLALSLAGWFDRHGTANEQLRAHYILGRTYADLGEAPQAIDAYNEAADRADTTASDCDYYTLCRVHAQKASVYYDQLLPDNMIHEERLAMKYAKMANDTMTYIYCYGMMAEGYDMKNMPDSALIYMKDAYQLYKNIGKDSYAAGLSFSLADIYLQKGEIQKAKVFLHEYETKTGFFDADGVVVQGHEIFYYVKGLYYTHASQLDSAEFFFRKNLAYATDINNRMAGYKGLLEVYAKRGNIDSLKKYTRLFMESANFSHNEIEMQSLVQVQSMYDYSRNERIAFQKTLEAKNWSFRFWITILLLICALLMCLLGYSHYRKLIRIYELEKRLKNAPVVLRLKSMANSNPPQLPELKDWKELEALVNHEIPSFYYTLNTESYTLSGIEYDVCLLIRVHLSPAEIYKLKDCSSGYITTLRVRLLSRIYGVKGTAKDFDSRILAIC